MKFILTILFIMILIHDSYPQMNDYVMATIGEKTISVNEFRMRYELSPFMSLKNNWNEDSVKYDFFYSLIAEKLWAMRAAEMGLEQNSNYAFYYKPLEEVILRDALFKQEVENKVKLSPDDINNGIIKYQTTLNTLLISSKDSSRLSGFYNEIKKPQDIDSLLTLHKDLEQQTLEIKLGKLKDEEVEDFLYSLNIGAFTKPIKSEIGWVIFQIKDRTSSPIDLSDEKTLNELKRIIRSRRVEKRHGEYLKALLSGIKITADEKIFYAAADKIVKRLSLKTPHQKGNDSTKLFFLDEGDYSGIRTDLGKNILSNPLFSIYKKNVPLEDFLATLAFKEFGVISTDSVTVYRKLNQYLKIFIEEQLITSEAHKKNLLNEPAVKYELEMWKDNYLAQMLKVSYLDSVTVSDNEVFDYYLNKVAKDSNIMLLNLQLVSLGNLDEISEILDQIRDGKDFGALIKKYGKTDLLVDENGETGLKPLILLGDIGTVAGSLETNQLYGPVRRNDSYSLFKVIEKKESGDSLKISFESDKQMLRNQLRLQKLSDLLNKKTTEFASGKTFNVNENVLRNTGTIQVKMFVHRLMGFGGRIAAVPVTDNWTDWIDTYQLKKNLLP